MMTCASAAGPASTHLPRARILRAAALTLCALAIGACSAHRPGNLREPEPQAPTQGSALDFLEAAGASVELGMQPLVIDELPELRDMLEPEDIRSEFGGMFLVDPGAELPEVLHQSVLRWVDFFNDRARGRFGEWLAREGRYGDLIRRELREAGLPEDLIYLAMIESGLSNTAVSRANAVGMWQFMAPTARDMGLRVDEWVDERRDPVRATRAAIRYLSWLHGQTNSWALAAASYNAGIGRVTRIQRETGQTDYFQLVAAGRLPEETRSYVPTIVAASIIARNRVRFGFTEIQPQEPFAFDTVHVEPFTRLAAVAEAAGELEAAIRDLNPHLVRNATPPGASIPVRIPVGTPVLALAERLAAIPADRRFIPREVWTTVAYTVKSGDSWWRIARANNTSIDELRKQNPRVPEGLRPGMRLQIRKLERLSGGATTAVASASPSAPAPSAAPASSASAAAAGSTAGEGGTTSTAASEARPADRVLTTASNVAPAGRAENRPTGSGTPTAIHVVASGETLSGLAQRYGVPIAALVEWNGMSQARGLRIGETLKVSREVPTAHRVGSGETMTGLARRYDLTVEQLARFNGMKEPRPLRAGETLRLIPAEPSFHTVAAGETMGGLARKYGVTVRELAQWNGMREPRGLRIGEKLIVTQPGT